MYERKKTKFRQHDSFFWVILKKVIYYCERAMNKSNPNFQKELYNKILTFTIISF